jgi:hypothetical protein
VNPITFTAPHGVPVVINADHIVLVCPRPTNHGGGTELHLTSDGLNYVAVTEDVGHVIGSLSDLGRHLVRLTNTSGTPVWIDSRAITMFYSNHLDDTPVTRIYLFACHRYILVSETRSEIQRALDGF